MRSSANIQHLVSWFNDFIVMLNLIESSSIIMLELRVALGNDHFTYLLATRSTSCWYDRGRIYEVFIFENLWNISLVFILSQLIINVLFEWIAPLWSLLLFNPLLSRKLLTLISMHGWRLNSKEEELLFSSEATLIPKKLILVNKESQFL